jgi:hypothetical protein
VGLMSVPCGGAQRAAPLCISSLASHSIPFLPKNNSLPLPPPHVQQAMLESLWEALKPGVSRQGGRITSEWGEIGFQGKDPASDFR